MLTQSFMQTYVSQKHSLEGMNSVPALFTVSYKCIMHLNLSFSSHGILILVAVIILASTIFFYKLSLFTDGETRNIKQEYHTPFVKRESL